MTMTLEERMNFAVKLTMLREAAKEYPGKTIDNIVQQMEARLDEMIKQETI